MGCLPHAQVAAGAIDDARGRFAARSNRVHSSRSNSGAERWAGGIQAHPRTTNNDRRWNHDYTIM